MNKRHLSFETFFFIIIILGVSFQLAIFIFYVQIDINIFDPLIENWKGGPIVYLANHNKAVDIKECPSETNILDNQKWKGTYPGMEDYFGNIVKSKKLSIDNPNYIPPLEEQIVNRWRDYLLCGTRMKVNSYFELNIAPLRQCPPPFKSCGKIDSLDNFLCMQDVRECPINYINYYPYDEYKKDDDNYILYRDGYIYYTHEFVHSVFQNSFILKDIIFSEDTPCVNTNYISTKNKLHKLDYYYSKGKCPFPIQNKVYYSIDSYSQRQFYRENNVLQKLYKLPNMNELDKDSKINFFIRSYIGLNVDCLKNMNDKDKKNSVQHLISLKTEISKSIYWNTLTIILDFVFLVLFSVKYIVMLTKYYYKKGKKPNYVKPLLMIIIVFSCIFTCIGFASLSSYPILDILLNKKCIDSNTHMLLNSTLLNLSLAKKFLIINIVVKGVVTLKYGVMTAIKYAS